MAVEIAEAGYQGLVIWSPDDVLGGRRPGKPMMPAFMKLGSAGPSRSGREPEDHDAMLRIRYAQVPVVSPPAWPGGGCELAVHCARRGACRELHRPRSKSGWPDPGAGGLATIARRAAEMATGRPMPTC